MRMDPRLLLCACLLSRCIVAECAKGQDHRTNKTAGVQIVDMTIAGTQSLSSGDIGGLEGQMMGGCYDDDSDQIEERVRALFQDRGYFRVQVQSFHITPVDPLKNPKSVKVEAEILEGERYRVTEISFTGNHHFDAERLRKTIPLKKGDLFERRGVAGGLEAARKLYTSDGYLDAYMIPSVSFTGSGVRMSVEVNEGPQYHMGKFEVFAKKELADRLRAAWDLGEGKTFDASYPAKFMGEHQSMLPEGFTGSQIQMVRNCPDAIVDIRFVVDQVEAAAHPEKPVECEESSANK